MHPSSIVHSLVRFRDGALLAHMGLPDMRVPISYALTYPARARDARAAASARRAHAGLRGGRRRRPFRCSGWPARQASAAAPCPCAYNAANEVAVAAFLEGRLAFADIASVVDETLARVDGAPARDLDDLVAADDEARRLAARRLQPA